MKIHIGVDPGAAICRPDDRPLALELGLELRKALGVAGGRHARGTASLDGRPKLQHMSQKVRVKRRDPGAAIGNENDEAFARQLQQSFANWRAR